MLPKHINGNYNDTKFLQKLQIVPEIEEKIKQICCQFDKNTFGVHIRRGDSSFCPWKKYYRTSTINSFIQLIDQELHINPRAKFYLATDCPETDELIKSKFTNKVLSQNKPFYLLDEYGLAKPFQKEALIDLICLSKTNKIIGSYWSSFSMCASYWGNIPLHIAQQNYTKNVSLIVAVKNRTDALKISLQSWLRFDEIAEIIIVDWSSDTPLNFLEKIDPRIKVIVVKDQKTFHVSSAVNLASRAATKDFILKMDADYVLSPYYSIFDYKLKPGEFITGHHEQEQTDNNLGFIKYLNGMIFIRNLDLKSVGGYDESFTDYGYEDCDLYNRLEAAGYQRTLLNHKTISVFHIPHTDNERSKHYTNKNIRNSLEINVGRALSKRDKDIILYCENPDMESKNITLSNLDSIAQQKGIYNIIKENRVFAANLNYNLEEINNTGRVLVIPPLNIFDSYFDNNFINFLTQVKIPILFWGLHTNSTKLMDFIKEKKYAIGSSEQETTSLMRSYGIINIFEIGCPSNLINKDLNFYFNIANKFNQSINHYTNITIIQDKNGVLSKQFPQSTLLFGKEQIKLSTFEQDSKKLGLCIGFGISGNMLFMQHGCPTIWVYEDKKTEKWCNSMNLPRISIESILECSDAKQIIDKAMINIEQYTKTRLSLIRKTRELLEQFGLS